MRSSEHRNRRPERRLGAGLFGWGMLLLGASVWLQGVCAQDAGQPARAVRLSYVDGGVQLLQNGQALASQAAINTPLFEGMQLTTAQDGRAEIQFEDGSVARLAPNSALTLQVLRGQGANGDAELVLDRGLAYFEFQNGAQIGTIRVHFGDNVASANGAAVIRVEMDTPPGDLAVFSGNVHVEGSGGAIDLHGGESVAFDAGNSGSYQIAESIEPDSWDAWNSDRDQQLSSEASEQTEAPGNVAQADSNSPAWSDLDANGTWYNVPDQGYVWSPYDASNPDFDPYGDGEWMWTPGFGYIWASGYSWGYLPYECGTWNFYGGFGWGWAPGFGGCHPWWGSGFYGGPNIGRAPVGYRPIPRPPRPPIGRIGHPVPVMRNGHYGSGMLPPRDRNTAVTIGGATVVGLRALPARSGYTRTTQSFPGRPGVGRSVYQNSRPGYVAPQRMQNMPVYAPPANRGSVSRGTPAPSRGSSGGRPSGGVSHPSGGMSHSEGGGHSGGGGGGGHSAGGGGRR